MKKLILLGCVLVALVVLAGCSTFESFHFKLPIEIAYGDTAVNAEQSAAIAKIEADSEVMKQAGAPHVVEVKLPPEMMPAIAVTDITQYEEFQPPEFALAPGASAMATMNDGTTLHNCVEAKGGLMECEILEE